MCNANKQNTMKTIKVGSDFSGVGAFNQALMRLGVNYEEVFACDMDKFARQTFIHNYGEPKYYPFNVYDREIPAESVDIYMTSPPCQSYSLAGKRLGKEDKRGILFFNSLEFIQVNKPRFFIFENVKGLLSDDGGKTFQEWVNLLGGKSINGLPVIFPYDDSVPYHLYWKVLNAKHHGVPQNRERVFLIGIRDDQDNKFQFPKEEHLTKRLKDVLEEEVFEKYYLTDQQVQNIQESEFIQERERIQEGDTSSTLLSRDYKSPKCVKVRSNLEKYYLSQKMIDGFLAHNKRHIEEKNQDGFNWKPKHVEEIANCLRANAALCATDNSIKIKSASSQEIKAIEGDSINFSVPSSETQRVRVGKGVIKPVQIGQSEKTFAYQNGTMIGKENQEAFCIRSVQPNGICINDYKIRRLTPRECFRLMDFPDTFTWPVSDSQAYKQAGNSIVVNVIYKILKNLSI